MIISKFSKRTQADVSAAVARYLAGDSVTSLARQFGVSKPAVYLWIAKYKKDAIDKQRTADMSPADAAIADKQTLLIEIDALRAENRRLRDKVIASMIKSGEL